jgi:hypothetical protein
MDKLMLRFEKVAEPIARREGALVAATIVLLLLSLSLLESRFRPLAFISGDLGIWAGGIATFGRLFVRTNGGIVTSADEPASVVGMASLGFQVLVMGFGAVWILGLVFVSCRLIVKIVS